MADCRPVRATVIANVDVAYEKPLFDFARDLCQTERIDYVLMPDIELYLAPSEELLVVPEYAREIFQYREIARSKAERSWCLGSRFAVVVNGLRPEQIERNLDYYAWYLEQQKREIDRWRFFNTMFSACITPEGYFVSV